MLNVNVDIKDIEASNLELAIDHQKEQFDFQ